MSKTPVIKKHWLYGNISFDVDVKKEDSCGECIHRRVCKFSMRDFCLNYRFGTSDVRSMEDCESCIHRFTRWDKDEDKIPCFKCSFFQRKSKYPSCNIPEECQTCKVNKSCPFSPNYPLDNRGFQKK